MTKDTYTPVEIMNLSPRCLNALINAGVGSIEQLFQVDTDTLQSFRGMGGKQLEEIAKAKAEWERKHGVQIPFIRSELWKRLDDLYAKLGCDDGTMHNEVLGEIKQIKTLLYGKHSDT